MRTDFCVFICSNGRAGSVTTIKALEGSGYTGDWYILCDDLDRQLDDYRREYGAERVKVFDKKAMAAMRRFYWRNQWRIFQKRPCKKSNEQLYL